MHTMYVYNSYGNVLSDELKSKQEDKSSHTIAQGIFITQRKKKEQNYFFSFFFNFILTGQIQLFERFDSIKTGLVQTRVSELIMIQF